MIETMDHLVNTDLEIEQLKLKIMRMKEEISRKQRKLQKCEKAAKNRSKTTTKDGLNQTKSIVEVSTHPPQKKVSRNEFNESKVRTDRRQTDGVVEERSKTALKNGFKSTENVIERSMVTERDSSKGSERLTSDTNEEMVKRNNQDHSEPTPNVGKRKRTIKGLDSLESRPLRRSSRLSLESQLLRSGDFVLRRRKNEKIENSMEEETKTTASNHRRLFPCFTESHNRDCNLVIDFVLPDSEYAALKLQVRKTKQLLCFREDVAENDSIPKGTKNEFPLLRSNGSDHRDWTVNCRLVNSQREPVLIVHCGRLRGCEDQTMICVMVQVSSITTWTSDDGNDWVSLEECRLDLRNCHKRNVHRLETESAVGTVCITSRKSIWIHACDGERRVTLTEINLRNDTDVNERNVLSCTVGIDSLWLAFVDSDKTRVKKYSFSSNLKEVVKETNYEEVCDRLNSLVCVEGLKTALFGTGCAKLYLWNNVNGKIIKVIEPHRKKEEEFTCQTCTLCVAQKGLLFLGVVSSRSKSDFRIVAINPNTSAWTQVAHFSTDLDEIISKQRGTSRDELREMRRQGQFLLTLGTVAAVWHLGTRKLLAFVDGQKVDFMTVHQKNRLSDVEIIVASNSGHVAIYSSSYRITTDSV